MSRVLRVAIAFTLVFAIVAGSLLSAGCGGGKKAALVLPTIELFQFAKGSTVDFDELTINSAANAEANVLYGTAKAIYHSVWAANQETVANALFPAPYWKGDGVTTKYAMLASGDQTTVDATIFANPTMLTPAEQEIVRGAVAGLFTGYDEELAAKKTFEQNTAYTILYSSISAAAATSWVTDATAWMNALNAKAAADYSGKTFAALTYAQRQTVMAAVFNYGAGTINPEYAFWRAMVQTSFRDGNASARWPDVRDSKVPAGKTYAALDCLEKAAVDIAVSAALTQSQADNVTAQIAGLWNLATEQVNGVNSDNTNIYYQTLMYGIPSAYTTDNDSAIAAAAWLTAVNGTTPGTTENTTFYAHILGGQTTWRTMLANSYFGLSFDNLTDASKAAVIEADMGMTSLSVAQRSAAMPLTSNVIYQTLQYRVGSLPAATGWATEAGAGINRELALYKWMGYEGLRNGTAAARFYPTQLAAKLTALFPGKTYTALTKCEQMKVNDAVWAVLDSSEQQFINYGVMPGIWGTAQAEMTDAIDMTETSLIRGPTGLKAATGTETSVINWKNDVTNPDPTKKLTVSAAYYRWLAKEALIALKGLGTLIRLSEAEFLFKVTNTNKYPIVISNASYSFYVNSTAVPGTTVKVDTAKVVAGDDIWVPAESELLLGVRAPVKQMGIITWMVMAGQSTPNAQKLAADVWSQYLTATASTWVISIETKVSNDKGEDVQVHTYNIPES